MKEKVREQFFPQQAQLCVIGCKLDFRKAKLLGLKKLVIFGRQATHEQNYYLNSHNHSKIVANQPILQSQTMLTPDRAIKLLHSVNLQINSHAICIKPSPSFNIINRINLMMDTRRSLAQLYKSYPAQKLNTRDNLISAFALLYSQFRTAVSQEDEPMLHRYLTNGLYQQWKEKRKSTFNLYPVVYDIKLKQAQIYENEYGKWIQCLIRMKYNDSIVKEHIAERKLGLMPSHVRKWYFVKYQN